jgi:hypothetical protein
VIGKPGYIKNKNVCFSGVRSLILHCISYDHETSDTVVSTGVGRSLERPYNGVYDSYCRIDQPYWYRFKALVSNVNLNKLPVLLAISLVPIFLVLMFLSKANAMPSRSTSANMGTIRFVPTHKGKKRSMSGCSSIFDYRERRELEAQEFC